MLNQNAMGKAFAITAALFWIVCSILVYLLPGRMMEMTGTMVHANLDQMSWHMPLGGIVVGLVIWTLAAGLFGWAVAGFYNRFAD